MRLLAYTSLWWRVSTRRMLRGLRFFSIGYEVLTAPPFTDETFPYSKMADGEFDLLYIRLHGLENQPYLYGGANRGDLETAFDKERIEGDLSNLKLVFLEGCYGAKTGIPEKMREHGAGIVIASLEPTMNSSFFVGAAGQVGKSVLRAFAKGKQWRSHIDDSSFVVYGDKETGAT